MAPAAYSDADHKQLASDEQQTLLCPSPDLTKTGMRKGDAFASTIVWVSLTVFVVITWAIILTNDPASYGWFSYHPLLQTLAIVCFTFGILRLQPTSQSGTKEAKRVRRQIAMARGLGAMLLLFGVLAMAINKHKHKKSHFTTWHGTLGISSVILVFLQAIIGTSTMWGGGALWGGEAKAKALWKYHRFSGYILFPLLLFTAHLGGGWSHWVTHHSETSVRLMGYSVAPFVILVGIYSRVRTSKMKVF